MTLIMALILAADEQPGATEVIAPYLPFAGIIAGAITVGLFNWWNGKRGAAESRVPTVAQLWTEQNKQRVEIEGLYKRIRVVEKDRDSYKNAFLELRKVFMRFVDRVGGTTILTEEEHQALELPVASGDEDDDSAQS